MVAFPPLPDAILGADADAVIDRLRDEHIVQLMRRRCDRCVSVRTPLVAVPMKDVHVPGRDDAESPHRPDKRRQLRDQLMRAAIRIDPRRPRLSIRLLPHSIQTHHLTGLITRRDITSAMCGFNQRICTSFLSTEMKFLCYSTRGNLLLSKS